ncbi:UNKNOWN [Stylonychia lemnae]|uniref:Uncharacterized protein n=1 Tax=Stylonychia lemnae TaxID=5949 RepID=A0A078B6C9_STYLE|nr:UNKNOWN [Stylonychia lemnae]|eukprot:CDW90080.1 UNKNOWN [Stylonychia lemnae]
MNRNNNSSSKMSGASSNYSPMQNLSHQGVISPTKEFYQVFQMMMNIQQDRPKISNFSTQNNKSQTEQDEEELQLYFENMAIEESQNEFDSDSFQSDNEYFSSFEDTKHKYTDLGYGKIDPNSYSSDDY